MSFERQGNYFILATNVLNYRKLSGTKIYCFIIPKQNVLRKQQKIHL